MWSHSEALNLDLWWVDGELRFWDPVTERWLLSHEEEHDRAEDAEARAERERAERLVAESRAEGAQSRANIAETRAESAESRVAELEAELRQLRGE